MFICGSKIGLRAGGVEVEVPAPLDAIPCHMAGGFVIPTAQTPALTTAAVRRSPLTLVVALKHPVVLNSSVAGAVRIQHAYGAMFHDDGESAVAYSSAPCRRLVFQAKVEYSTLTGRYHGERNVAFGGERAQIGGGKLPAEPLTLGGIKVLGWGVGGVGHAHMDEPSLRQALHATQRGRDMLLEIPGGQDLACGAGLRFAWESPVARPHGAVVDF